MKQVMIQRGNVVVEEVPAPALEPDTLLVRAHHSCVSVGTELSGIRSSGLPLWRRALARPGAVARVAEMALTQGLTRTLALVEGIRDASIPTGYSVSGTVLQVAGSIEDLRPGDRVACAGAGYAHHAELIRVPRNLVVPIPESLGFPEASTVTPGAIALQGVRRASPTLGETFVVLGLGLLGQLACQVLRANGCRVIGTDLERERIALALSLGMEAGVHPEDGPDVEQVVRLTDGVGADGVIITASTPSDAVVATAFGMCRRKGRVVLVGDVGLHLNRADFYAKELDFFVSCSYGPGRYDRNYEERGLDYPVAHVRWTENRNLAEYLRLLAEDKVRIGPLIRGTVYPVERAPDAYAALVEGGKSRPLMVLLSYPRQEHGFGPQDQVVVNPRANPGCSERVRLAVVGAGHFATQMHLPHARALHRLYRIQAVVSRTGHNAQATARRFEARYATTDYQTVLADPEVDAVLITTRHHLHGPMTLEALRAGKHVLVEKPLALTEREVAQIEEFVVGAEGDCPLLLTGYNRRFSPHLLRIQELIEDRTGPMILNHRLNAGYLPLDHWVHGPEGGGRNLGEACHAYDVFGYLTGARVTGIKVSAVRPRRSGHVSSRDNFVALLTFDDGSLATLTYTSLGCPAYPKERLEIFFDGKVVTLDDYRKTEILGARHRGLKTRLAEKGHREELERFARCIREGGEWPIPLWQQLQASRIAFEVERGLNGTRSKE